MQKENRFIYQPFKINAYDWQAIEDEVRTAHGKKIFKIIIGTRIEKDEQGEVLREDLVTEEVYQDVLQGIFTQKDSYKVRVRLGREPNVVITYNGELICHNDKIEDYVMQLFAAFDEVKKEAATDMLVNGVLNENIQERFTKESQQFVNEVNLLCTANYPPEFITIALKKYLCENGRYFDLPGSKDLHYTDYAGLMHTAGEVLKGRLKGVFDEDLEAVLLDELLYRILSGSLMVKE